MAENSKIEWTDDTKPWDGAPLHPERAQYHALKCSTGDAAGVMHFFWVPAEQWGHGEAGGWTLDPLRENAYIFTDFEYEGYHVEGYLGVLRTPSEQSAREAANYAAGIEACASEIDRQDEEARALQDESVSVSSDQSLSAAVRALPLPTDADAALAKVREMARQEGAATERAACARMADNAAALAALCAMHPCIAAIIAGEAVAVPSAALGDIVAERRRHVEAEGWSHEHDDSHATGAMARAAGCYALHAGWAQHPRAKAWHHNAPGFWPWETTWWKPSSPRRDLVKAAALIVAEIERIDRAASPYAPEPGT